MFLGPCSDPLPRLNGTHKKVKDGGAAAAGGGEGAEGGEAGAAEEEPKKKGKKVGRGSWQERRTGRGVGRTQVLLGWVCCEEHVARGFSIVVRPRAPWNSWRGQGGEISVRKRRVQRVFVLVRRRVAFS